MVDLRTPDQRAALPVRREPYWSTLQQGCALGYRRGRKGGTWVARWRDLEGRKRYSSIGEADHHGHPGLSYESAYEHALRVIVRSQQAELACAEPAQAGNEVIDEAAAGALVKATLVETVETRRRSRHQPPPPINLAALAKDLTSAKRLYEARLRRRISRPKKATKTQKRLATAARAMQTALTQVMSDDAQRSLLAKSWGAMTACQNRAALADVLGAEAALARIATDMNALGLAAEIAQRLAVSVPSEEREIVGTRSEYDLFARVLPRLYERYFHREFGVRRDAYAESATRLYGPGVTFVMGAAELIGIRNRSGDPYTPDVILDARRAAQDWE